MGVLGVAGVGFGMALAAPNPGIVHVVYLALLAVALMVPPRWVGVSGIRL